MNNDQSISFDDLETTKKGQRTMNTQTPSFIPQAAVDLTDSKGHRGQLANFVLNRTSSDVAIDEAICLAAIECDTADAPFHVMSVISFFQLLMDKVSWNARKLFVANQMAAAGVGIYGLDGAQRAIDTVGVNATNEDIHNIVKADYEQLFIAQSELLSVLEVGDSMDIDLFFFNPAVRLEDGSWDNNAHCCDSFDSALDTMNSIVDDLKAKERTDKMQQYKKMRDARLKERLSA